MNNKKILSKIILVIVVLVLFAGIYFFNDTIKNSKIKVLESKISELEKEKNNSQIKEESDKEVEDYTEENVKLASYIEDHTIRNEVFTEIKEYVNKICNTGMKISEFQDINDADKSWIYTQKHISNDDIFLTNKIIEDNLKILFGDSLKIDIENDLKSAKIYPYLLPEYDEKLKGYVFLGYDNAETVKYIINDIKNNNDIYTVNVIEYEEADREYEANENTMNVEVIIKAYDETDSWKKDYENIDDEILQRKDEFSWKEIFTLGNEDYLNTEKIEKEVLNRKDEFCSYNLTIEKEKGLFHVKRIERVK